MARKIKIKVKDNNTNINLPSIPISFVIFSLRFFKKSINRKLKENGLSLTYLDIMNLTKALKKEIKHLDPFILVEVENEKENEYILIEVR